MDIVLVLITKNRQSKLKEKIENHQHIDGRSSHGNRSNNQGEGVERKENVARYAIQQILNIKNDCKSNHL